MKLFKYLLMLSLSWIFATNQAVTQQPQLGEGPAEQVISQMTVKEKAILLVGTGMSLQIPDSLEAIASSFLQGGTSLEAIGDDYAKMVKKVKKLVPGAAGTTAALSEFNITPMVLADGPAGLRISPTRRNANSTYYCTAFPIATLLASSWDTELVREVGKAMGNEVLEYGADIILGPGMNLQRNPLCGRNFEYYSEDPLITGKMAAAMVNGIQSQGVGTSIKHFAANNQETQRNTANSVVTERALRELYLEGFRIAVEEAQPWTVMSSYNKINGVYTSQSYDLLTKILRDDWGFNGFVTTDWFGGTDVVAQMKAGNDLIMPGQPGQIKEIISAVEEGELEEEVLDRNLKRILNILIKTPRFKDYQYSNDPDLEAHASVARKAASEGMVLLKNDKNTLPLKEAEQKIALFGTTSYEIITGGTGSGDVNEAYSVSLMNGLSNANYQVNDQLKKSYQGYIKKKRAEIPKPDNPLAAILQGQQPIPEMEVQQNLVSQMAKQSDIALITIGRNSGEGGDRKAEPGDFNLSDTEQALIKNVCKAFHEQGKKAIVVLNIGGVIETASWREHPDAILLAWQAGQETGNSIADVISGKVNPSGKLAVTFPMKYSDVPSSESFPGHALEGSKDQQTEGMAGMPFGRMIPWEVEYKEDIYVGYRYYSTFDVPTAYEFGYGLSYTNFSYDNLEINSKSFDKELQFSVEVKNTGSVAGREAVQVYLSAPEGKLKKPSFELVAFKKTQKLEPGERQTLSFTLNPGDLASFDSSVSSWIAESGTYKIHIGASSEDFRQSGSFVLEENRIIKKVNKSLEPKQQIETF
jgi:beta-glucosidase